MTLISRINSLIFLAWRVLSQLGLGGLLLSLTACINANSNNDELTELKASASYRERMALPPEAHFIATLEQIDAGNAVTETVARTELSGPLAIPIPFSLRYRTDAMTANGRYQIHARILLRDKVLFQLIEPYAISAARHQQPATELNLLLKRAFAPAFPGAQTTTAETGTEAGAVPAAFEDVYWQLHQLNGASVSVQAQDAKQRQRTPYLLFQSKTKRLVGFGGCNHLQGSYTVSSEVLRIGQTAGTLMACAQGMEQEQAMLSILAAIAHWQIRDDRLQLLDKQRAVIAEFVRAEHVSGEK